MRPLVNVHDLIHRSADTYPDRPAVTFKDVTLTYQELWEQVRAAAAGLQLAGLRRGERVALFVDKRPETVVAMFAVSLAGGVSVPVNPVLKASQVGYVLRNCDVAVLVTTAQRARGLREQIAASTALRHVVILGDPIEELPTTEQVAWSELVLSGEPTLVPTVDSDIAAILYTSGSTGSPKGVVLSHRNIVVGAESVSSYLGNTADDVILSALPLSFDAGLSQLTTAFCVGAHVILHNYLLPRDVPRLCAEHQVTGLTCVPPLWIQLAGVEWPAEASASLRYFANTGGRMPKATLDQLRELFPQAAPYLMYGLTEAFRSTYLDPAEVDRRPDSIGKAIPNAEILVLRPDGTECDPGEEGELVHRGPLVALGYWNDAERSAERFRPLPGTQADWRAPELAVFSGDAVVRDEEGFLYFVGRKDDMIKTSGYRVSPTEVEEVAYSSGLVRDAVALGADDDRLGQRIVLLVTPVDPGLAAEDLVALYRREVAGFMVPAEVKILPDLPRSPNGKFDRASLKKEHAS